MEDVLHVDCFPVLVQIKLGGVLSQAKRVVEDCREQYDQLVAEDKVQHTLYNTLYRLCCSLVLQDLDRSFKRDFADCDPYVDQLYRLFRRRPR